MGSNGIEVVGLSKRYFLGEDHPGEVEPAGDHRRRGEASRPSPASPSGDLVVA